MPTYFTDYSDRLHVAPNGKINLAVHAADLSAIKLLMDAAGIQFQDVGKGAADLYFGDDQSADEIRAVLSVLGKVNKLHLRPFASGDDTTPVGLQPEQHVRLYRTVDNLLDSESDATVRAPLLRIAEELRLVWKEWQGEDCIREMAFGEPWPEDEHQSARSIHRRTCRPLRPASFTPRRSLASEHPSTAIHSFTHFGSSRSIQTR